MTGAGVGHWVVESDKKQFYRVKRGYERMEGEGVVGSIKNRDKTKIV